MTTGLSRSELLKAVRKAIETQESTPTTPKTAPIITGRIQALQALEAALGPEASLSWLDVLGTTPSRPITDMVPSTESIAWAAYVDSIFAEVPA